jgi:hypothetical protein
MGTWGTALFSDDLAADLRGEFRDLVGSGLTGDAALARLESEYASSLRDPDDAPVFWLAVAHTAWKIGRPIKRATAEALRIVAAGTDLRRWPDDETRRKRMAVLERLQADLQSPPPAPKRIARPIVAENAWSTGELICYRLASGASTLFRVIGHHQDKGGRHAVCEPLDWVGNELPPPSDMLALPLRQPAPPWKFSQFMLGEPRKRKDVERFARTGLAAEPSQRPGGYIVFVFPHVDRLLLEYFGLR